MAGGRHLLQPDCPFAFIGRDPQLDLVLLDPRGQPAPTAFLPGHRRPDFLYCDSILDSRTRFAGHGANGTPNPWLARFRVFTVT